MNRKQDHPQWVWYQGQELVVLLVEVSSWRLKTLDLLVYQVLYEVLVAQQDPCNHRVISFYFFDFLDFLILDHSFSSCSCRLWTRYATSRNANATSRYANATRHDGKRNATTWNAKFVFHVLVAVRSNAIIIVMPPPGMGRGMPPSGGRGAPPQ